jgi:hypothetical protein
VREKKIPHDLTPSCQDLLHLHSVCQACLSDHPTDDVRHRLCGQIDHRAFIDTTPSGNQRVA